MGIITNENALELVRLLFTSKDWINRRVDSVSFPDGLSMARRVSVDISLASLPRKPRIHPSADDGYSMAVLPIALIRKEILVNFDFWRDSEDQRLPKLTRCQGRDIMTEMLVAWAKEMETASLESARKNIQLLLQTSHCKETLKRLLGGDKCGEKWGIANPDKLKSFLALARMLSRDFILFLPLEDGMECNDRTIVKYSYERPLHLYQKGSRIAASVKRAIGLEYMDLVVPASDVGYSASYHFELNTPSDVAVMEADLYDDQKVQLQHDRVDSHLPRWLPEKIRDFIISRMLEKTYLKRLAPEPAGGISKSTRLALYSVEDIPYETRGQVALKLVAVRPLWLWALSWLTLAAAVMLWRLEVKGHVDVKADKGDTAARDALIAFTVLFGTTFIPAAINERNDFSKHVLRGSRITGIISSITLIALLAAAINSQIPRLVYVLASLAMSFALLRQALALWRSTASSPRFAKHKNPEHRRRSRKYFLRSAKLQERRPLKEGLKYEHEYISVAVKEAAALPNRQVGMQGAQTKRRWIILIEP
ncbi:hypothetical protein ACFY1B_43045 [Streptomyces mirabilis]|uniref:hypothetical protein n=1 Tax=Streptomyces mirabilis TaxID=68239 RepID=UPI0036CABD3D